MKSVSTSTKMFVMVAAAMMVFVCTGTGSASLVLDATFGISNSPSPSGPTPWLTASFSDTTPSDTMVTLTLSSAGLTGNEFVSKWFLNSNPSVTLIGISQVTSTTSPVATLMNYYNAYPVKADGDGYYNIEIRFPTSGASRFAPDETAVFTITATRVISPDDFDYIFTRSYDPPGSGGHLPKDGYLGLAHVQGIGTGTTSNWVAFTERNTPVPIPPSVFLLACGLVGMVGVHRLRKKQ